MFMCLVLIKKCYPGCVPRGGLAVIRVKSIDFADNC